MGAIFSSHFFFKCVFIYSARQRRVIFFVIYIRVFKPYASARGEYARFYVLYLTGKGTGE